ncbi:Sulfonamide resistance protein [Cesiribacter andamanensis AMV16]|uniref:Sulfonamide resistance protein n=1 Tax=Cesiribacter andamanensis AMV16 TaxID=1279009 RepID=M7N4H6_9BACT|nr:Sulfonamide resistance protein [Cesiribacter andamanensis AMV16]
MGALSALGPFTIDMYLPGFPAIAADLNTSIARVGLSLTSYFIGISVGQLFYGPLVDRYGRKKPLLAGLLMYIVAAIGCALSPTVDWLIWQRLLLALGGCAGIVASRAMVRDLFPTNETARVFSTLILIMGVAPIIAPTIGGYVTAHFGWRIIFYVLVGIAALLFVLVYRFLPESKQPDPSISLRPLRVLQEYGQVVREPEFLAYAFAGSIAFAGLFAYISGSPFVFMEYFQLSETWYGWLFGLNAFGFILGSQINRLWLRYRSAAQISRRAVWAQAAAGLALAAGSLLGLLSTTSSLALIFIYMFFIGFIAPNATALALKPFTRFAGSASALLGSLQMLTGALASGLVSYLHNGTPMPMAFIMAGGASLSLLILLGYRHKERRALAAA